jgi:predicted nucleotidyltransferase
MKNLNYKELRAYASAFVSFILPKIEDVSEIILFGSTARGEADKKSDIDLFFNIENTEKEVEIKKAVESELKKFYKSKIAETFFLRGIKNQIKINAGKLENWKLKRSIISDGIILYGKYREAPKNMKGYVYFNISPIKNIAKRNRIIRKLFGRKEKKYSLKGILDEISGKKFSSSAFIVPKEKSNNIIELLGREKVSYKLFELWTDEIAG